MFSHLSPGACEDSQATTVACCQYDIAGLVYGGGWGWCLLLQDIGVTRQAFQYDPRAQLSPASQPAVAVTQ
eukprot:COSAG01_NODE_25756_length_734_cov_1.568504_1_plen_70_part_10